VRAYAVLRVGALTKKTATDPVGGANPAWGEGFVLTVGPNDALHLSVEADDPTWDDTLGLATIGGRELLAQAGTEVWVPLVDSAGRLTQAEVLLAIGDPNRSVRCDTPAEVYYPVAPVLDAVPLPSRVPVVRRVRSGSPTVLQERVRYKSPSRSVSFVPVSAPKCFC